ncbi:PTS transporter subunit EIIB [Rothia aeria]
MWCRARFFVPANLPFTYAVSKCSQRAGAFYAPICQTFDISAGRPRPPKLKEKNVDHKSVAERVLQDVGGVDNIRAAAHCATRLRLVLKTRIPLIKVLLTMTKTLKAVS